MVEIGCFLELQFLVLEQVPKDVTDASVHADLYSLVAVFLRVLRTTFLPRSM